MAKKQSINIRLLEEEDIEQVAEMEYEAWHSYYSQYGFYETIKESTTKESIAKNWQEFIGNKKDAKTQMVTGDDRKAYVALLKDQVVGVGAVCDYKVNIWPPVDDILRKSDGSLRKTAKLQNLYIHKDHRGKGIGHHLGIVRADYMLEKGYEAIFATAFADATRTLQYHIKNGMMRVYDYESLQTFKGGDAVMIACFLHMNAQKFRDNFAEYTAKKIDEGEAYSLVV